MPRTAWTLEIQIGRGPGACRLVVTSVLSVKLHSLQSCLHHLEAVEFFMHCLSSLCLTFLIREMGIINISLVRIKGENTHKPLSTVPEAC